MKISKRVVTEVTKGAYYGPSPPKAMRIICKYFNFSLMALSLSLTTLILLMYVPYLGSPFELLAVGTGVVGHEFWNWRRTSIEDIPILEKTLSKMQPGTKLGAKLMRGTSSR